MLNVVFMKHCVFQGTLTTSLFFMIYLVASTLFLKICHNINIAKIYKLTSTSVHNKYLIGNNHSYISRYETETGMWYCVEKYYMNWSVSRQVSILTQGMRNK